MNLKIAAILLIIVCSSPMVTAKKVEVKRNECIYSVNMPQEWNEIPIDSITTKFKGIPFDIGLHNSRENHYFDGDYLQYAFLKSQESLNQFSFITIAQEAKKSIDYIVNNPQIGEGILTGIKYKIDKEKQLFFIKGTIINNEKEKQFLQVMIPTKFGYVKVILYSPIEGKMPLSYIEIAENIIISDEYKYIEPKKRSSFDFKHLLFALILSVLVFAVIQFFPRLKLLYTAKK